MAGGFLSELHKSACSGYGMTWDRVLRGVILLLIHCSSVGRTHLIRTAAVEINMKKLRDRAMNWISLPGLMPPIPADSSPGVLRRFGDFSRWQLPWKADPTEFPN